MPSPRKRGRPSMSGLDVLGGFVASAIVVVLLGILEYRYRRGAERFRRR